MIDDVFYYNNIINATNKKSKNKRKLNIGLSRSIIRLQFGNNISKLSFLVPSVGSTYSIYHGPKNKPVMKRM